MSNLREKRRKPPLYLLSLVRALEFGSVGIAFNTSPTRAANHDLPNYEHNAGFAVGAAPDAQDAVAGYADAARLRVCPGRHDLAAVD